MSHKHQDKKHADDSEAIRPDIAEENNATESCQAESANTTAEQEEQKLKKELAETQEKLIYLQADYQNYRKRTAKDISDARVYGAANALEPFITVYDYLSMARQAAENSENIEQIRQGLGMIIDQYIKAFEESGVSQVETVGTQFDPTIHEAVAHEPSEEYPEGIILKEWAGGYRFGQRLLRPAKVVVSSGSAAESSKSEEA
ncbi:MAG: nucleotide exchange factor GrpE [Victivallales bacterium]|jgi:molecular chaperone GrpE|nr:nucleotide exchange factor GrpE [Victivallales bacterium]